MQGEDCEDTAQEARGTVAQNGEVLGISSGLDHKRLLNV